MSASEGMLRPLVDPYVTPEIRRVGRKLPILFLAYGEGKITLDRLHKELLHSLSGPMEKCALHGYTVMCSLLSEPEDPVSRIVVSRAAKEEARAAALQLGRVTKEAFHAAITKKRAVSQDRGDTIASYELPRVFFMGARKGWSSKRGSKVKVTKRWLTGGDNPCELCLENEDEGPLSMDDVFSSRQYEPPGHPNCECYLGLYF